MNERQLRRRIAELREQRRMTITSFKIGLAGETGRIGVGIECDLTGKLYRAAQSWSADYAQQVGEHLVRLAAMAREQRAKATEAEASPDPADGAAPSPQPEPEQPPQP